MSSWTRSYSDSGTAGRGKSRPAYLVLAMQSQRPADSVARYELTGVTTVAIGRAESLRSARTNESLEIGVHDEWMSSEHAQLVLGPNGWLARDVGAKNGCYVDGQRVDERALRDGAVIELGSTVWLYCESGDEPQIGDVELRESAADRGMTTLNPAFAAALQTAARVAQSTIPILVRGDSGVGKELVADALHRQSGRTGRMVAVNCGAIASSLMESELFGHERGAFSGALTDRKGWIRSADGGTLFLDEVAELPMPSQAALLRAIQENEVVPVGSSLAIDVDVRVIAATHQDLSARVERGEFRRDLYARLTGFELRLPALRNRMQDLGLIVGGIVGELAGSGGSRVSFARDAARALFAYDWPLNVRELRHALATALAVADDCHICIEHLPPAVAEALSDPFSLERAGSANRLPRCYNCTVET